MTDTETPRPWIASSREQADEWALVLTAAGISHHVERTPAGWAVIIAWHDRDRAAAELAQFARENPVEIEPVPERQEYGRTPAGILLAAALLAFYAVTGPRAAGSLWFRAGSADAGKILAGEAWRTVTALTLHADMAHVVGNVASCVVFVTAACRELGPGLGLWLVLLAGAAGNGLTAVVHVAPHSAVGASTALFGALGILAGLQCGTRRRRRTPKPRAWVPLAAGLALLALLGTGENADVAAHLFGFAAGVPLGAVTGLLTLRPLRGSLQRTLTVAAAGVIAGCWTVALSG
jgi:membrane associated rhomboid family serine protease